MQARCILVSGLPGSGKSTLARRLSHSLAVRRFDKDDFLEQLFERQTCDSLARRAELSRQADALFRAAVAEVNDALLVSHWRPLGADFASGTPVEWIVESFRRVIEIYCTCSPAVAAERFAARRRRGGHCDHLLGPRQVAERMMQFADRFPLRIEELITIDAHRTIDYERLAARLGDRA